MIAHIEQRNQWSANSFHGAVKGAAEEKLKTSPVNVPLDVLESNIRHDWLAACAPAGNA